MLLLDKILAKEMAYAISLAYRYMVNHSYLDGVKTEQTMQVKLA